MLELDTTIMTPAPVFETSGHVARFADWMVKDTKTGDVLRADHLVKSVLEARLAGDKEARGLAAAPPTDEKKKKKNKSAKKAGVKLDDVVVKEYETILAQVSFVHLVFNFLVTPPFIGRAYFVQHYGRHARLHFRQPWARLM
jgi:glycyl-tRNA synthetase